MNIRQRNIIEQQKRYNEAWKKRVAMMLDEEDEPDVVNADTVSVVKDETVNVATVNDMPKPIFREKEPPVEAVTEEKTYGFSDNAVEDSLISEEPAIANTESIIEEPTEDIVEYEKQSTDEYDDSANIYNDVNVDVKENISVEEEISAVDINDDFDDTFGSVNNVEVSFNDEPIIPFVETSEQNDVVAFSDEYDDNVNIAPKRKRGRPVGSVDSGALKPITISKKTTKKKATTKKSTTKKTKK